VTFAPQEFKLPGWVLWGSEGARFLEIVGGFVAGVLCGGADFILRGGCVVVWWGGSDEVGGRGPLFAGLVGVVGGR